MRDKGDVRQNGVGKKFLWYSTPLDRNAASNIFSKEVTRTYFQEKVECRLEKLLN